MKKIVKLLSLGFLAFSLVGCSCAKEEVVYTLDNSKDVYEGNDTSLTLSTKQIYDYIRNNETKEVNIIFLKRLMNQVLDVENNTTNKAIYELKLAKYFEEKVLDSSEYKSNGLFDEELFAAKLESELYIVDRVNKPTSGVTFDLGLKYDYSNYIEKAVDYSIFLEMLKEKYILEEKPSIIDDSRARIISIYTTDNLDDMVEIVDELYEGVYENLAALTKSKRDDAIKELGRQYCEELGLENEYYTDDDGCGTTTNNSTYDTTLRKFTVCENGVRCTPAQGLQYQVKLAQEKVYLNEQVVNKNTTGILYEQALRQLFNEDVEDHLHEVIEGEDYFLGDWLYNNSPEFTRRHIILTTGPDSDCYIVTVRVVDSETTNLEDRDAALSLVLDKVSETTVLSHYLEDLNVEVNDPVLKDYYNTLTGK